MLKTILTSPLGLLALLTAAVFGVAIAGTATYALVQRTRATSRDAALEARFLDECAWAPAVPAAADGSVPARVARNVFPLCYIELLRAKNITSNVTLASGPPPAPPAPVAAPLPAPAPLAPAPK